LPISDRPLPLRLNERDRTTLGLLEHSNDGSICVRCGRSCSASATKALDADLVRTMHGFDALLVLTGSTASANL